MDELGDTDESEADDVVTNPSVSDDLLFLISSTPAYPVSSRIMKLTFLIVFCCFFSLSTIGVLKGLGGSKINELSEECDESEVSGEIESLLALTGSLFAIK